MFPTEQDAKAAREQIAGGKTFDDIVKARGLKPSDTDLGMVTKAGIIDPAIAKAAFALKPGEVSQPIKGSFGTVLVTVGKIEPGQEKSFDEVKPQIKHAIAESEARNKIGDLRDKIEDERAAGSTLAEAGKKLGPQGAHDRRRRPRRQRRPTASRCPICRSSRTWSPPPSAPMSASTTTRCNCRAAAISITMSAASRPRASARSPR